MICAAYHLADGGERVGREAAGGSLVGAVLLEEGSGAESPHRKGRAHAGACCCTWRHMGRRKGQGPPTGSGG